MFLYSQWLNLPLTTRATIATAFGIAKTGPTHVQDNRVVSDGYDVRTVEANLNVDSLQKYLASDEPDMAKLWKLLVDKTEGREVVAEVEKPVETVEETAPTTKKRGRPAKTK